MLLGSLSAMDDAQKVRAGCPVPKNKIVFIFYGLSWGAYPDVDFEVAVAAASATLVTLKLPSDSKIPISTSRT